MTLDFRNLQYKDGTLEDKEVVRYKSYYYEYTGEDTDLDIQDKKLLRAFELIAVKKGKRESIVTYLLGTKGNIDGTHKTMPTEALGHGS